jgi:hypothetical protein
MDWPFSGLLAGIWKNSVKIYINDGSSWLYIAGLPALAVVDQHPVKDAVILLANILQHFGEEFSEKVVVRGFLKAELADVVHVDSKLF